VRSTAASAASAGERGGEALDFIRALHRAPHATFVPDGELDWSRAPPFLPSSLGASLVALPPAEAPWQGAADEDDAFAELGRWLASSLMCHRTRVAGGEGRNARRAPAARRALASGGAAYPADLYLRFGADWAAVSPLLPGHWWLYLPHRHSLAAHCAAEPPGPDDRVEAALVTVLSRTAFKYREFAYRLSAVDTGVALGRLTACLGAGGAGFEVADAPEGGGPPLIEPEEQAAARIVCRFPGALRPSAGAGTGAGARRLRVEAGKEARRAAISAGQPSIFAALAAAPAAPAAPAGAPAVSPPPAGAGRIALPDPPAREPRPLRAVVHARRSEATAFSGVPVPLAAVAACLRGARGALAPLHGFAAGAGIGIGCALIGVDGVGPVAGLLDGQGAALEITRRGSVAEALDRAMLLHAFDMRQCGFVLHVIADIEGPLCREGPVAYRRSQMAVGAMLDAATLAAVENDLSAHAFLGFSAPQTARLYGLDPEGSVLPVAQLCVGRPRQFSQWETAIVG